MFQLLFPSFEFVPGVVVWVPAGVLVDDAPGFFACVLSARDYRAATGERFYSRALGRGASALVPLRRISRRAVPAESLAALPRFCCVRARRVVLLS